jgi:hypothetical protein
MTDLNTPDRSEWQHKLAESLPLFGHRNWIVVADAAYPAHADPGIETVLAGADQMETVRAVAQAIAACPHIRAKVFTDAEIGFVAETDAPGAAEYRHQLDTLFAGSDRAQIPHEQIIERLDRAAKLFRILILKTCMTIPYTSVFFELDCGYWSPEAEARLRHAYASSASAASKDGGR